MQPNLPATEHQNRAAILSQALPYFKRYHGATIVVKYGGNAMVDEDLKRAVMDDIVLLSLVGVRPVLVHGGGPEISETLKRMGKESTFVHGLRVTDAETVEVVEMVLAGKTNKGIVSLLQRAGAKAVGLSGRDGDLFDARKILSRGVDVGYVGEVTSVNPEVLDVLAAAGYIPVISTVGEDEDGHALNINADHAAGQIAAALKAAKLILLTDVPGVYEDYSDKSTFLSEMTAAKAREMLASGKADKGMIPKMEGCLMALDGGCERAHILDGRVPNSILTEIFTTEGCGTMLVP
ncbi:MAG TPA: acetylglutamate kinase [Armatimonadota bacterium]|jgi:acetylglutamate kinase